MVTTDFLVIGGGIIGLSIARELRRRYPGETITLLEKERTVGQHASGRNSGVLHAGFYYTADSLKARFCRQGNLALHAYCDERAVPVNRSGKLVVASNESELATLDELERRGKANGVPLRMVTEAEAREIEPRAITFQRALFSPSTSSVDPAKVMAALREDAVREGIRVVESARYLGCTNGRVETSVGKFWPGHVVNAAGLYADTVARDFGFGGRYRILPFKGLYLYSDEPPGALKVHIYPVPNIQNPFLGVHFTVTPDGHVKIGPTAIPALWREQYEGLSGFSLSELMEIGWRGAGLFMSAGFDFRRLAQEELRKQSRAHLVALAAKLCRGVKLSDYNRWGRPGMRAQLLDVEKKKLEMDFVVEGDVRSTHVLNAVSPAFTASFPFAQWVCDKIKAAEQA